MSAAPQRGRRRAEPQRQRTLLGLPAQHRGTHSNSRSMHPALAATVRGVATLAVVGALVGAGVVAKQLDVPTVTSAVANGHSLASIASMLEGPPVAAATNATIKFPGLEVSSSARPTVDPMKAEAERIAALAVDDAAAAQAYAAGQMASFGWGADQMSCLIPLWERESGWRTSAANPSSGAYGIPQSLPAGKMSSAGADWATNYETQVRWGLGYIQGRYGSPCGAMDHSNSVGWY
ncbi:hypothetical protein JOF48_000943 [Arthrobacter stackebrandtii]|uniref:Lytic transglycosylase domain-containing protein n=1 Tax=Arthrobacter stackebrandtii TaxID=272161 RepID=A0ABS4YTR6_9MICC|nr:hypothetical protein [Arthrobacter stackebrandtii]MBP2412144.1 hypothetical protein [Arthrobacter stackebrandtii]